MISSSTKGAKHTTHPWNLWALSALSKPGGGSSDLSSWLSSRLQTTSVLNHHPKHPAIRSACSNGWTSAAKDRSSMVAVWVEVEQPASGITARWHEPNGKKTCCIKRHQTSSSSPSSNVILIIIIIIIIMIIIIINRFQGSYHCFKRCNLTRACWETCHLKPSGHRGFGQVHVPWIDEDHWHHC